MVRTLEWSPNSDAIFSGDATGRVCASDLSALEEVPPEAGASGAASQAAAQAVKGAAAGFSALASGFSRLVSGSVSGPEAAGAGSGPAAGPGSGAAAGGAGRLADGPLAPAGAPGGPPPPVQPMGRAASRVLYQDESQASVVQLQAWHRRRVVASESSMMRKGTVSQAVLPFLGAQTAHLAAMLDTTASAKDQAADRSAGPSSSRSSRAGSEAGTPAPAPAPGPAGRMSATPAQARSSALRRRPQRVAVLVSTAARTVVLRVQLGRPAPADSGG